MGEADTVTLAVPLRLPLWAVTVYGPPKAVPAVNRPPLLMVPPPFTLQTKGGWVDMLAANWSRAVAVSCWVAEGATVAVAGASTMLVKVWLTVTVTVLVTVWLP